jgi:hypothetical protein
MLDKMVPGAGAAVVARKVLLDQLTWTPVINTAFFFSTTFMATGDVGKSVTQVGGARRQAQCLSGPSDRAYSIEHVRNGWILLHHSLSSCLRTAQPPAPPPQVTDKLWPTMKVNLVVWPVLQTINMSMVPLQYRLLYVNVCSLFWSAFLSNMASSKAPAPVADKAMS